MNSRQNTTPPLCSLEPRPGEVHEVGQPGYDQLLGLLLLLLLLMMMMVALHLRG